MPTTKQTTRLAMVGMPPGGTGLYRGAAEVARKTGWERGWAAVVNLASDFRNAKGTGSRRSVGLV